MRQLAKDFLTFIRSIVLRWVNLVGGALIAFLQLLYHGKEPDWSLPAILIACFLVASFLAWRDEHAKNLTADRREVLYKIRDLIQTTAKSLKVDQKYDSFGALLKFSNELKTEEDVVWVTDARKSAGFLHPFEMLDKIAKKAFLGHKLEFLREARASNIDIKRLVSATSFAAKGWSRREIYVKEHRAYAGWQETEE